MIRFELSTTAPRIVLGFALLVVVKPLSVIVAGEAPLSKVSVGPVSALIAFCRVAIVASVSFSVIEIEPTVTGDANVKLRVIVPVTPEGLMIAAAPWPFGAVAGLVQFESVVHSPPAEPVPVGPIHVAALADAANSRSVVKTANLFIPGLRNCKG